MALIAMVCTVQAAGYSGLTMQWGPGQVYFEIYKNNGYYYSADPYYYYGSDYYYFPNNFRYNYNSQWYYQNSGWFYYNGNNWYRDNAWRYYDNYWYNPTYSYYYYPTAFYSTDYSMISSVEQIDKPYCTDIDIATRPITINEGQTSYEDFYIDNKSNFIFSISRVIVVENDSEVEIDPYSIDDFIPDNSSGTVTLRVQADPGIESKSTTAYLKIEGYFDDSEQDCSFSDISENFQTYVKGSEIQQAETDSGSTDYSTAEFSGASPSNYYYNNVTDSYNTVDSFNTTTNYLSENSISGTTACSNIISYTKRFFLAKNDSKKEYFIVKNDSDKAFFVESIQAFDDSEFFTTTALKADGTSINAHGALQVPIRVDSFENSAGKTASGTFKISGVFEDNSYCGTDSIGNNDFSISAIEDDPETPNQNDFQIFFPETIQVPENGPQQITVTIVNNTGNSGYIKVYSPDAFVDPQAIVIPSTSNSVSAKITISNLDANKAWLFYDIFLPNFTTLSRVSKIVKVKAITATPQPQPQPIQQNPNIDIQTTVQPLNDGNYNLNVTVQNQSNFPVSGSIEVDLPSGWEIQGNPNVSLGAMESRTIMLQAMPPSGFNDKDVQAQMLFQTSTGFNFSEPILLKANRPAFAAMFTAFAVLGANAFWLGLLVLALIAVSAFYFAAKIQNENSEEAKLKWKKSAN